MHVPLYEKLRPQTLSDVVGQEHLVGNQGSIRFIIESGKPVSLLGIVA